MVHLFSEISSISQTALRHNSKLSKKLLPSEKLLMNISFKFNSRDYLTNETRHGCLSKNFAKTHLTWSLLFFKLQKKKNSLVEEIKRLLGIQPLELQVFTTCTFHGAVICAGADRAYMLAFILPSYIETIFFQSYFYISKLA